MMVTRAIRVMRAIRVISLMLQHLVARVFLVLLSALRGVNDA